VTPERWQHIKAMLAEVLTVRHEERGPFLARFAGSDPELHAELRSLLAAHDAAQPSFLETPAAAHDPDSAAPDRRGCRGD
jgi:hypothetical protein